MKYFAAAFALLPLVPHMLALTINTPPSMIACQPTLLTWTDGVSPFYVSAIPGGQPSAPALKSFATQTGQSYTWLVDLPGLTRITLMVKDSLGNAAFTDTITIQQGADSSCLTGAALDTQPAPAANPPAGGSSPTPAAAAVGATTPAGSAGAAGATTRAAAASTTPAAAAGTTRAAAATNAASSSAASARPSAGTSGASSKFAAVENVGLVGIVGLLGVLVL